MLIFFGGSYFCGLLKGGLVVDVLGIGYWGCRQLSLEGDGQVVELGGVEGLRKGLFDGVQCSMRINWCSCDVVIEQLSIFWCVYSDCKESGNVMEVGVSLYVKEQQLYDLRLYW